MDLRDVLTAVALGASLWALLRSYRLDKRDLFLKMHTELLGEMPMAGRRALSQIDSDSDARVSLSKPAEQTAIYRALALFDVLGLYVEQGWVDRWTVMDEWANSLSQYQEPKRLWAEYRWKNDERPRWPHYDRLAKSAMRYLDEGRPGWFKRWRLDLRDRLRRARRRLA